MLSARESEFEGDPQILFQEFQEDRKKEREMMESLNLVDKENAKKSLSAAISFRGSSSDMCPTFERVERQFKNQVSKWEKDPMTGQISKHFAIKTFMRPSGQAPSLPSDVRPPQILSKTLNYIIEKLLPKLPDSQSFIWDRTRSIRQDFTFQNNYSGIESIDCHEKICRIHILSLHVMAGAHDPDYQQQQEVEQFNNSLQTLTHMYDDVRSRGGVCPNEPEFRAYELISKIDDTELDRNLQKLPEQIISSPILQRSLMLRGMILQGIGSLNLYTQFFKAVLDGRTPFLLACLSEIHFNEVRYNALRLMSRALHSKSKMPDAGLLASDLGFDTIEDCLNTCKLYQLPVEIDGSNVPHVEVTSLKTGMKKSQAQPYTSQINNIGHGNSYQQIVDSGVPNYALNLKEQKGMEEVARESFSSGKQGSQAISDILSGVSVRISQPAVSSFVLPQKLPLPQQRRIVKTSVQTAKPTFPLPQPATLTPLVVIPPKPQELPPPTPPLPPPPPPPPEKLVDLPGFQDAAEVFVDETVKHLIAKITPQLVQRAMNHADQLKQGKRKNIIDRFSQELYRAFMREQIYLAALKVRSEAFRDRRLKLDAIRRIKKTAKRCIGATITKRAKLDEILSFQNNIIPLLVPTLPPHRVSPVPKSFPYIPKDKTGPIDIAELMPDTERGMKMLAILRDPNDVTTKWIQGKLNLGKSGEADWRNGAATLHINTLSDDLKPNHDFVHTDFILLQVGSTDEDVKAGLDLADKLTADAKLLAKVVEYLQVYNRGHHTTVLVLHFDRAAVDYASVVDFLKLGDHSRGSDVTVELVDLSKLYEFQYSAMRKKLATSLSDMLKQTAVEPIVIPKPNTELLGNPRKRRKLDSSRLAYIKSQLSETGKTIFKVRLKRSRTSQPSISLLSTGSPPTGNFCFSPKEKTVSELNNLADSILNDL
ncbi:DEKNAAC101738 [Brettanomyces naardenensis]|uniref:Nuclear mRNA export factor n=1 Tax=Brettanomyces naardenensis TaxID=13370 RepID=A0A448YIP2_BRENA|nr:DEKNAAC101738 [Brettanomyces naardenensis]